MKLSLTASATHCEVVLRLNRLSSVAYFLENGNLFCFRRLATGTAVKSALSCVRGLGRSLTACALPNKDGVEDHRFGLYWMDDQLTTPRGR